MTSSLALRRCSGRFAIRWSGALVAELGANELVQINFPVDVALREGFEFFRDREALESDVAAGEVERFMSAPALASMRLLNPSSGLGLQLAREEPRRVVSDGY
jgi:hypothetical protein